MGRGPGVNNGRAVTTGDPSGRDGAKSGFVGACGFVEAPGASVPASLDAGAAGLTVGSTEGAGAAGLTVADETSGVAVGVDDKPR